MTSAATSTLHGHPMKLGLLNTTGADSASFWAASMTQRATTTPRPTPTTDHACNSTSAVCGGDNTSCADECGVPNGDNTSCADECGVPNGDNTSCADECGVPNGDNSTCTGCMHEIACNYDETAIIASDDCDYSCIPSGCFGPGVVVGCTAPEAVNFNPDATCDGGCVFEAPCPGDIDGDSSVGMSDLLDLLSAFGLQCEASVESSWSCGDPHSYQGYDYATVLIGDQCWFAENLRSENYENGDAIPAGLSDSEWENTSLGAVAVYGENASNLNEYGRLYNWYAVDDARGLCPSGWHVPTDGEWTVLTDDLGGWSVAGGKMKTTYGWYGGGNGTNSSGFSGLPGGGRDSAGNFYEAGNSGVWWSSSPNGEGAWQRVCTTTSRLPAASGATQNWAILFVASGMPSERSGRVLNS